LWPQSVWVDYLYPKRRSGEFHAALQYLFKEELPLSFFWFKTFMSSLACATTPAPASLHPLLQTLLTKLRGATPTRVLCSPCSSTNEVFSVLVTFAGDRNPEWLRASCLAALSSQSAEVDITKGVRQFKDSFRALYDDYGAVNVSDVDGVVTFDASIGDRTTATTAKVHLLPDGAVVCFETKDWMPLPTLSILQRTAYAAARTFDALLLRPAAHDKCDRSLELRLVEKQHLARVVGWGECSGAYVVRSPGAPLSAKLVLRAFADGSSCDEVVCAIVGDDSGSEPDGDLEWQESDESMDEEDDSDGSEFDELAAEEELANLR